MIVVVDSNILFSVLLQPGTLAPVFVRTRHKFRFIAPEFVREELLAHLNKLSLLSGLEVGDLNISLDKLLECIELIEHSSIDANILEEAYRVCRAIDEKDTLFVAMAIAFQGKLLTGDKKLRKGLERNGYFICMSATELLQLQ